MAGEQLASMPPDLMNHASTPAPQQHSTADVTYGGPGPIAGPPEAPPPPPPPPPPQAPAQPPPRHLFRPVPGGVARIAAKETDLRGPKLRAAQQSYNDRFRQAVQAVNDHTQETAATDYAMALGQERKARIREEAADQSVAERGEDLAMRQADFDNSVRAAAAHMRTADGGYWANKSAPQKIGAAISLMLGGIIQARHGGQNPAAVMINREIDREVKAQEDNYHIAIDRVKASQTAFGMAMQKYKNEDAARTFARAAALDTVKAQIAQQAASWKSTGAKNAAEMAMADLEGQRMAQIQAGIHFRPEQAVRVGPTWVSENGVRYNEAQMRALEGEGRKFENTARLEGLKGENALALKQVEAGQKAAANRVELPAWGASSGRGEVVAAPSKEEAQKLRAMVAASSRVEPLAKEAMKIKQGTAWRIPGTDARRRLEQIQAEVDMVVKDSEALGALQGADFEIIRGMTGSITNQVYGQKDLEHFKQAVRQKVKDRVRTYPGSTAAARAETPTSFRKGR